MTSFPLIKSFVKIAIFTAFITSVSFGNPMELTLSRAIELSLERYPSIAAAAREAEAAEEDVKQAAKLPNPSLETSYEGFAGQGEYSGYRNSELTLAVNMPVDLSGKISKREGAASVLARAANLAKSVKLSEIKRVCRERFLSALVAEKKRKLAKDDLETVGEFLKAVRKKFELGEVSGSDVMRVRIESAAAEIALVSADGELESAKFALAQIVGISDFNIKDEKPDLPDFSDIKSLFAALENSAAVKALESSEEYAKASATLAVAEAWPDFEVSLGAKRYFDSSDWAMYGGLNIPLPVFDRNINAAAAHLRAESAAKNRQAAILEMRSEMNSALKTYSASLNSLKIMDDFLLRDSAKVRDDMAKSFLMGDADLLDAIDARRSFVKYSSDRLQIFDALWRSAINIEYLIGK